MTKEVDNKIKYWIHLKKTADIYVLTYQRSCFRLFVAIMLEGF